LHDQTLQDLAGLKVLLSGARRAKEREQVDRIVEQAIEHVQLGVDALRGLVTELRPAALDELGTAPALRALIDRTAATSALEIELNVDLAYEHGRADTRHAPELESTLYRLVQEALTNVVKHAGAGRVTVQLIEDDATVQLTVIDDGAGFQTDAASEGFGLIGMRERIALIGGALVFDSLPGAGTTVAARIPVQRRPPERSARTPDLQPARRSA
jgi:signal transduction histidine kinase